jgi:hypothetical protein
MHYGAMSTAEVCSLNSQSPTSGDAAESCVIESGSGVIPAFGWRVHLPGDEVNSPQGLMTKLAIDI